jgi:hypothetical protein
MVHQQAGCLGVAILTRGMSTEHLPKWWNTSFGIHISQKSPSLFVCDSYESHLSIKVQDVARTAGVTMLTLPPHCSHKLQPLVLTVTGSLKAYCKAAVGLWLTRNASVPGTIYQVTKCTGEALMRTVAAADITDGFKISGTRPYDTRSSKNEIFKSSCNGLPTRNCKPS